MTKLSYRRNLSFTFMLFWALLSSGNLFAQDNKIPDGVGDNYVFALTNDTAFQIIGLHADGSMMLIKLRNNSNLVEKMAFRKTDTSEVFLMHFDTAGYPETAVFKNQLILFGNFRDKKADIIICRRDGTDKEVRGVDFDLPKPLKELQPLDVKKSGPCGPNLYVDGAKLSDAIGWASTCIGMASCGLAIATGGAYALPCVSALIDVASTIIPEKYKTTKLVLATASTILSGKGFLKAEVMTRMEIWQQIYSGATYFVKGMEDMQEEKEMKKRQELLRLRFVSNNENNANPGSASAAPNINLDDYATIIKLYDEGTKKLAALKTKTDELGKSVTKENFQTLGPQITELKNQMDATKKDYCNKINAIAGKHTILFGFKKYDPLPYSIRKIVLTESTWNSDLSLYFEVYFSCQPLVQKNPYADQDITTYMKFMSVTYLFKNNERSSVRAFAVGKKFRDEGVMKVGLKVEDFIKVPFFEFNSAKDNFSSGDW